jgi:hypothetical protein
MFDDLDARAGQGLPFNIHSFIHNAEYLEVLRCRSYSKE